MKPTSLLLLCLMLAGGLPGCSPKQKPGTEVAPAAPTIIGTAATNDPVFLQVVWRPGKRYVFRVESVLGLDVTPPEPLVPKKLVFALGQNDSVLAGRTLADGGQELDLEIMTQRFFYQADERNFLIMDSRQSAAQDAADPISPLLRKLVGAPIKCFTDADGKLVKTEGLTALAASLQTGNPQMKAAVEAAFTEKNLKVIFDCLAAVPPALPLKIGASWPVHCEPEVPGLPGLVVTVHCTPAAWEMRDDRECVRIEFSGDIAAKPGSSLTTIEGGTLSGTAWFDPQLGMLVHSATVGHLNVKTTVLNQTVSTRVNLTSNVHLLGVATP